VCYVLNKSYFIIDIPREPLYSVPRLQNVPDRFSKEA
jgi:hypothetical protein